MKNLGFLFDKNFLTINNISINSKEYKYKLFCLNIVALKNNNLIADDTDSVSFLSAFNGVEISTIENKIKWIASKKLCVYFINQLLPEPKLIEEKNMWSKLENIFIDKDGKPMDRGAKENQKIFLSRVQFLLHLFQKAFKSIVPKLP